MMCGIYGWTGKHTGSEQSTSQPNISGGFGTFWHIVEGIGEPESFK